jgi:hypothetical protein
MSALFRGTKFVKRSVTFSAFQSLVQGNTVEASAYAKASAAPHYRSLLLLGLDQSLSRSLGLMESPRLDLSFEKLIQLGGRSTTVC